MKKEEKKTPVTVNFIVWKTVDFSIMCSYFLKDLKCPNTPQIYANWDKSKNDDGTIGNFALSQFTLNQCEFGQHRFFLKTQNQDFTANCCIWHAKVTAQKGFFRYILKTQPKHFFLENSTFSPNGSNSPHSTTVPFLF